MNIKLPRQGQGFILRAATLTDASALAEIEFDIEVKGFLALPEISKSSWIEKFWPDQYQAWVVEIDGALAGRASLGRMKRRGDAELSVVIAKPFWKRKLGRGVAGLLIQIAFEERKAKAVVGIVHPKHVGSIGLLRAFKFRRRGVHVGAPEWQDGHLIYRLSRRSYEELAKR